MSCKKGNKGTQPKANKTKESIDTQSVETLNESPLDTVQDRKPNENEPSKPRGKPSGRPSGRPKGSGKKSMGPQKTEGGNLGIEGGIEPSSEALGTIIGRSDGLIDQYPYEKIQSPQNGSYWVSDLEPQNSSIKQAFSEQEKEHIQTLPPDNRIPELKSFKNFLWMCFRHLKITPTEIQYDIADKIQYGPKRQIISAYRGIGKSYINSMFTLWYLYWNPTANVLVVSAAKQRADSFSSFCFRLINEIPELQFMAPKLGQRMSMAQFDVSTADPSQSASVTSLGIYGQLTGARADLIIADDVEVPKTSDTHRARTRLAEAVKEFESIIKPREDSKIVYIGTPQCEDSLYNKLIGRGYIRTLWPARIPSDKWMQHNGHELSEYLRVRIREDNRTGFGLFGDLGESTDSRFTEEVLIENESGSGRSTFDLQMMLDTTLSDQNKYPLKLRDLIVMEFNDTAPEHPVWAPSESNIIDIDSVGFRGDKYYGPAKCNGDWRRFEYNIMAIDPAGTGDDELAYCVLKSLNGILYLSRMSGLKGGYAEHNMEAIVKTAKEESVKLILVESNFGDGMFENILKPYLKRDYPCQVESIKHTKQKELRIIDTLEPIMNSHKLVIRQSVIEEDMQGSGKDSELKRLFFQMTRVSKVRGCLKHDDRLDCLAMAASWFKEKVSRDAQNELKLRQQKSLDREIAAYWAKENKANKSFLSKITGR